MSLLSWIAGYVTWSGIVTFLVYLLAVLVLYRNIMLRRELNKAKQSLEEFKAKQEVTGTGSRRLRPDSSDEKRLDEIARRMSRTRNESE
jgi:predicted Holliday junction resolvase-like endonuclease